MIYNFGILFVFHTVITRKISGDEKNDVNIGYVVDRSNCI